MIPRLLLWFAALALLSACVAILGMDPLQEKPLVDGGSIDAATTDQCPPIAEPGSPPLQVNQSVRSVHFAFRELDFGIDASAPAPGYDLDGIDTRAETQTRCAFAKVDDSDGLKTYRLDRPGGRDNAIAPLMQTLGAILPSMAPEVVNRRLTDRRYGVVFRIDGWNGTDDDELVSVKVFPTIGYWLPDGSGGLTAEGDRPEVTPPSTFEPTDLLTPDGRFQEQGGSKILSRRAYVRGGRLVAYFPAFKLPIRSSIDELRSFDLDLVETFVAADLRPSGGRDGRPTLERGVIAGRLPVNALLAQMALLFDTISRSYVCRTSADAGLLANLAIETGCNARDIRSGCEGDPSLPCDALSFGVRFETYAVDGLGPFRTRTDDDYRSEPERLPPGERCPGTKPLTCPN